MAPEHLPVPPAPEGEPATTPAKPLVSHTADSVASHIHERAGATRAVLQVPAAVPEHLRSLWADLLPQHPSNEDLYDLITYVPSLREAAGKLLLTQDPSNGDLCHLITYVPSLREAAGQQLLTKDPDRDELLALIRYVPSFREAAQAALQQHQRID
jgi:hypothetical protein